MSVKLRIQWFVIFGILFGFTFITLGGLRSDASAEGFIHSNLGSGGAIGYTMKRVTV